VWRRALFRWLAVASLPLFVAAGGGIKFVVLTAVSTALVIVPGTLTEHALVSAKVRPPLLVVAWRLTGLYFILMAVAVCQAVYGHTLLDTGSPAEALGRVGSLLSIGSNLRELLSALVGVLAVAGGLGLAGAMAGCTGRWSQDREQVLRFFGALLLIIAMVVLLLLALARGAGARVPETAELLGSLVCLAVAQGMLTGAAALALVAGDAAEARLFGPKVQSLDAWRSQRRAAKRQKRPTQGRPPPKGEDSETSPQGPESPS
jgi:hypothetical protein